MDTYTQKNLIYISLIQSLTWILFTHSFISDCNPQNKRPLKAQRSGLGLTPVRKYPVVISFSQNWQQMLYSCNHLILCKQFSLKFTKPCLLSIIEKDQTCIYIEISHTHTQLRATHVHELFQAVRTQGLKASPPLPPSICSLHLSLHPRLLCFTGCPGFVPNLLPLSNTHTFVSLSLQRLCWTYFSISIMTFVNLCILNFH